MDLVNVQLIYDKFVDESLKMDPEELLKRMKIEKIVYLLEEDL
jgi:hypothetical protein